MKELVIKISDDIYEWVRDNILFTSNTEGEDFLRTKHELTGAIAYGKVLPKGHGRLIDIDKAIETEEVFHKYFHVAINPLYGKTIGCTAPTVIEADKEDKE